MCVEEEKSSKVPAEPVDWTFYKEIRDQIKHEDGLTNQQMTWLITLQSFLFGAYGFVVTHPKDPSDKTPLFATFYLSFVGGISALLILLAISGALSSVWELVKEWRNSDDGKSGRFPPIIGTYTLQRPQGTRLGRLPVLLIPVMLCLIWICVALTSIYLAVKR